MRRVIALAIIVCSSVLQAETFLGPTTPANRLLIGASEAIVLTAIMGPTSSNKHMGTYTFDGLAVNIRLNRFFIADQTRPYAFSGPGELILITTNLLSFHRLKSSQIRTMVVAPNSEGLLDIPDGKSLRAFFPVHLGPDGSDREFDVEFSVNNTTVRDKLHGGMEISGPATLKLLNTFQGVRSPVVFTYVLTDPPGTISELNLIRGPTGSYHVIVERSFDLKTWFDEVHHSTSSDHAAFYRLKIGK